MDFFCLSCSKESSLKTTKNIILLLSVLVQFRVHHCFPLTVHEFRELVRGAAA